MPCPTDPGRPRKKDRYFAGKEQRHPDTGVCTGGDEKDTADSGQLLQKLREGRNGSFLFSIEIAVDAGMQRGKRNREGQNPQHGYGTGFF